MNNLDVQALRRIFDLLQTHFPERLSELWFLNAPWIFWGALHEDCVRGLLRTLTLHATAPSPAYCAAAPCQDVPQPALHPCHSAAGKTSGKGRSQIQGKRIFWCEYGTLGRICRIRLQRTMCITLTHHERAQACGEWFRRSSRRRRARR